MIDLNDAPSPGNALARHRRLVMVDLSQHTEDIARRLLGEPNRDHSTRDQWRYGTHGSLAIELANGVRGAWYDHERKEGGNDPWSLLTIYKDMTPEDARSWLSDAGFRVDEPNAEKAKSRIVATYDYTDERGNLLFQVVRLEPKTFRQRRPDGNGAWIWSSRGARMVPYHLPDVLGAQQVCIVEGEKDADSLKRLGIVATTNPGGSGKWVPSFALHLKGKDIAIFPDNDEAGQEHARQVVASLHGHVRSCRLVTLPDLPPKGDVSDWIAAGGTAEALGAIVEAAATVIAPPIETAAQQASDALPTRNSSVPDWTARLVLYENGEPRPSLDNCALALEHEVKWRDVLWFDDFAAKIVMRRPPPWVRPNGHWVPRHWTDEDDIATCRWMQQCGILVTVATVHDAIINVARQNSFHPVLDYLDGLTWDGTPRLDRWLCYYCGAQDTPLNSAIGARWMISAVARIYVPGAKCDNTLIFVGHQRIKKSTAFSTLAGPEWFTDDIAELGSKDSALSVAGAWIIELSELDSMARGEISKIKAFLSRTVDRFRPPYGRALVERPRQCVFAGSTNEEDFLRDHTGNHRFWPVRVVAFDIEALKADRDQLWAESVSRYRSGEKWYLSENDLIAASVSIQNEHFQADAWDNVISEWIANRWNVGEVTVSEILSGAIGLDRSKWSKQDQDRVVRFLKRNKWKRVEQPGRGWVYVKEN